MKKTEFWYGKLKFWIRGMYVVMGILLVLLLLAAANKIAFSETLEVVFAVAAGLAIAGSYAAGKTVYPGAYEKSGVRRLSFLTTGISMMRYFTIISPWTRR